MAVIIGKAAVRQEGLGFGSIKIERTPYLKKMPSAPTSKPVESSTTSGLNSNTIRGSVFDSSSRKMKPDKVYITRYQNLLAKEYQKALRAQLNRRFRGKGNEYTHVGYATSKLYKSVDAEVVVKLVRHRSIGRIDINYKLIGLNNDYGDTLAFVRRPMKLHFDTILKWVKLKARQGSLKINTKPARRETLKKNREDAFKNRNRRFHNVAWGIVKKAEKTTRPAVLKDWNIYDKNERLQRMFNEAVRKKGSYHRSQIRKSIVRNMSK